MKSIHITRREWLAGTGASLAAFAARPMNADTSSDVLQSAGQQSSNATDADRARRMKWWHEAKFGMFIHFGTYSVLGREAWAMEQEAIPLNEYELLAKRFNPMPNAARTWARLAKSAGQRYMVMTTKHHEGFCNFNTELTNYCAPQQAAGRDLVREYVEAARAEGLRVGFYYSLMDWHHPDGARCRTDEEARKRFVKYTHGLIREILTNYGKIDILWYDENWPLDAAGWESARMNQMVFDLQPDIIVNDRNDLPGDFVTPEQEIRADDHRAWESCMTLNDSWGYHHADDAWKSSKTVVRNLIQCANGGGNYLLNIGPKADGSVPQESVNVLTEVGQWMSRNGETIYGSEPCATDETNFANFTRKGNTLFMHVYFWPGGTIALGGLRTSVKSARLFASGKPIEFHQDRFQLRLTGLPEEAPDHPVTTIALECESEPVRRDLEVVARDRPRAGVGVPFGKNVQTSD